MRSPNGASVRTVAAIAAALLATSLLPSLVAAQSLEPPPPTPVPVPGGGTSPSPFPQELRTPPPAPEPPELRAGSAVRGGCALVTAFAVARCVQR